MTTEIVIHYEDRKPAAVTTAIVPQLNVAQEDPEQAAVELLASKDHQRVGNPCPVEGWKYDMGIAQGHEERLPCSDGRVRGTSQGFS